MEVAAAATGGEALKRFSATIANENTNFCMVRNVGFDPTRLQSDLSGFRRF